ncbi:hypothetical protein PY365_25290 [Roseiarcaceae bacterium H3SJ34-1]|uniref:hypothetical protein n=1 Tax=Terripilifer ovatus TaxID=3032367 RepID=UPI003AB99955|nr:hypothetical protein [Roseiarcaceae bacterium H3SJ34-1]
MAAFSEANSRIDKATQQLEQLKALLDSIHSKSKIETLVLFNQRGAEKLAAHWGKIADVPVKIVDGVDKKPPPRVDSCIALFKAEGIDVFLRFPDPEEAAYAGIDAAAKALDLDIRKVG